MDRLYKILIIDDDEYSADNLCLELKRYGQLMVEGIARNGSNAVSYTHLTLPTSDLV